MSSEIRLEDTEDGSPLMMSPSALSGLRASSPDARQWWLLVTGFLLSILVAATIAGALQRSGDWAGGLAWERDLLLAIPHESAPAIDLVLLTLPWLSSNTLLLPIVIIISLYLWRSRGRGDLALQLIVVDLGTAVLTPLLKVMFARPRPELWEHRGQYAWASYPSGHAMIAIAVYGTIALLAYRERGLVWPTALLAILAAISLYSRMYLGVHWPTDVLAGLLIGAVWLAFTVFAFRAARVDGEELPS